MIPSNGTGAPILLVDDDAATRALIAMYLRRNGFNVHEAASGEAALGLIEVEAIALIVLDMSMPGMSGTDVIRGLRGRPQTATLPIMVLTGKGNEYPLETSLSGGADDYLTKPVQLDELVARVQTHLRRGKYTERFAQAVRERALIAETIRGLRAHDTPEATAQAVCRQVLSLSGASTAELLIFGLDGRAMPIGFAVAGQPDPPLRPHGDERSEYLRGRAAQGPWIEPWVDLPGHPYNELLTGLGAHLAAHSPMRSDGELIGLLVVDAVGSVDEAALSESLPAVVEFADLAAALIGREVAERREAGLAHARIAEVIAKSAFYPVFQPIVDLQTHAVVGYEALTRFENGVSPDGRFADAAAVGLGAQLEAATLRAALLAAEVLPRSAWLSLNASPALILAREPLRSLLRGTRRRVVLEVTEHAEIANYEAFRAAVADLGPNAELAVDDAGAGFASLRHILELRSRFAKLDISLVRAIDVDELRQALIAGLVHFALRSDCHLIAEGVESDGEASALKRLGVEFAQGYLFGRPEPVPADRRRHDARVDSSRGRRVRHQGPGDGGGPCRGASRRRR